MDRELLVFRTVGESMKIIDVPCVKKDGIQKLRDSLSLRWESLLRKRSSSRIGCVSWLAPRSHGDRNTVLAWKGTGFGLNHPNASIHRYPGRCLFPRSEKNFPGVASGTRRSHVFLVMGAFPRDQKKADVLEYRGGYWSTSAYSWPDLSAGPSCRSSSLPNSSIKQAIEREQQLQ